MLLSLWSKTCCHGWLPTKQASSSGEHSVHPKTHTEPLVARWSHFLGWPCASAVQCMCHVRGTDCCCRLHGSSILLIPVSNCLHTTSESATSRNPVCKA